MIYKDVFRALAKKKVRYLVIGGVAVNLYGFARTTLDLDLVIALDQNNRTQFYKTMRTLGFKSKKPALAKKLVCGEISPGKTRVVSFYRDEFELIDVFIQSPLNFEKAFNTRKTFRSEGLSIPTVSYTELLAMKKASGRDQDLIDIGYLKKIYLGNKNEK